MIIVSIIIPCYNQGKFLEETLNSVYNQKYQNWECLIINDGSTDDTEVIGKKWSSFDKRFKYFFKENGGLSSARNFGILNSKGDWLQLLDSDDLIEENKIESQIQMVNHFQADILISGYRYFYSEEGISKLRIIGRNNLIPEVCILEQDNVDLITLFETRNPFVISAPLYKKSIFEKVGLFDEALIALEDWDFHLRCAKKGIKFQHAGYGNLNRTLIRIHDDSMMGSIDRLENAYLVFASKHYFTVQPNPNLKKIRKITRYISLIIPPIVIKMIKYLRKNAY